jgi:phage shock protein A
MELNMKKLKRWSASIVTSFDWLLNQVENHEAMVNAAIREAQEAGAKARVRLGRVKNDGFQMRTRLSELHQAQEQWKDRALKVAKLDEKKALECLKRRTRVDRQIADLEAQEREHARVEKQLTQDLTLVDERLAQLKAQRNLLRTRQSRAEALQAMQGSDSSMLCEIDDIFERWETRVTEYEMQSATGKKGEDELELEFTSKEEEEVLRESLKELLEQNPNPNPE